MTTPSLQNTENKLKTIVETGKPGKISTRAPDGRHQQVYINKQTISKLKPALETYAEEKTGGLFPLLALLSAILAGVGSAAGIAGGVASAVNNAKQAAAADKDRELKQAMLDKVQSKGVYLNPHEGRALYDFLKLRGIKLKQLKNGNGIYLNPHESKTKGLGFFIT